MAQHHPKVLQYALEYAARGWYVFPLHSIENGACTCGKANCSDAGKHPRTSRGVRDATIDPKKIAEWWGTNAPPSNIGIATGEDSNITVIDVDVGEGKYGAETWAQATKEKGEPDTLIAQTGGGGMHVFFQYNSALKTATNVLGPDVDCRNDGGYIIAPPSLHRSGATYEWLNDPRKRIAALPAHLTRAIADAKNGGRPKDIYRAKYTIEQVAEMLSCIPADDRDLWRNVGIILGRAYNRADEAWEAYQTWADKWTGTKGRGHDEIMRECFYDISQRAASRQLNIGTLVREAIRNGWAPKSGAVPIENFIYYGPGNNYVYRPTMSFWIAAAVDAAVSPVNEDGKITKASDWLKKKRLCTSMTRDPALEGDFIPGHDCRDGDVIRVAGAAIYNGYRHPTIKLGDAAKAKPFVEHVQRIFNKPGDADQFLNYMAHRVQKPWEKPRFALLIAGGQGIGKDTAIEMCCPAIGAWNVANIEPSAFESGFNEYAAATLVRISEAANLHDMNKWAFNERTKVLIAGSPDVCQINPKYGSKYSVRMFCGVIITTNHLASGIYIPEDDRRYDVIEAATLDELGLTTEAGKKAYFEQLWGWYMDKNGASHVAAFLHARDISSFSAANGQRKTEAHAAVVATGMVIDQWLVDILDDIGRPKAIRGDAIEAKAVAAGEKPESVRRRVGNAMARAGYATLRKPSVKDGRWRIGGKNVTVYVRVGAPGLDDFDPERDLAQQEPF